jgi:glycerol-3-phosphate dehydrogenase
VGNHHMNGGFPRDVVGAKSRHYEVIVIGGGIHGIMLTLEAARRGLSPLLIERQDFGGATSLNTLRILHGGLRHLQRGDFRRYFESVRDRRWFIQHFPELCGALPCLMPLYRTGLRRPAVFRVVLAFNEWLSGAGVLPRGRVLSRTETLGQFPLAPRDGLSGGALWYDAHLLSPQRAHAEALRWAVHAGATVLNYVEAIALERNGARVSGVRTNVGSFGAPVVINAAGPWAREVAARLDRDLPEIIVPSLAFNVLFDFPPPSDAAVAVRSSRVFFVTPHRGRWTLAGTVHRPWNGHRQATDAMIDQFIGDLRAAIPGWGVGRQHVRRVTSGVLPAKGPGEAEMAKSSLIVRHGTHGLFSVRGTKYTTAHAIAVRTLNHVFGTATASGDRADIGARANLADPQAVMALDDPSLRQLAFEESVLTTEDMIERRMDWILDYDVRAKFEARLQALLPARAEVPRSLNTHA